MCQWNAILDKDNVFYSLALNCFVVIEDEPPPGYFTPEFNEADYKDFLTHEVYEAVKHGVPKSLDDALVSPQWGEPARTEVDLLFNTTSLVTTPKGIAVRNIKENGAQVLYIFPVYEKKKNEAGQTIYKVRLVVNGSKQKTTAADTYAATPSREQLLILLHVIAINDWEYWHVDESRAFLSSERTDQQTIYAIIKGDPNFYEIQKALYGLRTSPRDYQLKVQATIKKLGYTMLPFCPCIFIKVNPDNPEEVSLVFDYVDDFLFTGTNPDSVYQDILTFRTMCQTTLPKRNADEVITYYQITKEKSHIN